MSDTDAGESRDSLQEAWESLEGPHLKMGLLFNALEGAEDRESALAALARLEDELEEHFALEEGPGGLYETLGTEAKGAAAVLADHAKLREVVTRTRANLAGMKKASPQQTREAAFDLGTELRSHEKRERALVRRILSESPTA